MHLNHYFLKRVADELRYTIINRELTACFSQNNDELILIFGEGETSFFIKVTTSPLLCCLSFGHDFAKASQGAHPYFKDAIGHTLTKISVAANDRSIVLHFGVQFEIVLKMHGKYTSVLLSNKRGEVVKTYPARYEGDFLINTHQLDKEAISTEAEFSESGYNTEKAFPAMGREIKNHLLLLLEKEPQSAYWNKIQTFLETLHESLLYVIKNPDGSAEISFFKKDEIIFESHHPLEIANQFARYALSQTAFAKEKKEGLTVLSKKIKQTESYINTATGKLAELSTAIPYEHIADILMANLYNIEAGNKLVSLFNFYTDQEIEIKLKDKLSPQKNAEQYYRKAKNQKIELQKLAQTIEKKREALLTLLAEKELLESKTTLKELRQVLKNEILNKIPKKQQEALFKEFNIDGFKVLVGRNSENNDLLTLKYANKNDIWLHARNTPGSHVVIKETPGKIIPKTVLEKAAELAAYYSKAKTDTLCPVIYTFKKFVRKRKGAAAGQVIVEKEEVILVTPQNRYA